MERLLVLRRTMLSVRLRLGAFVLASSWLFSALGCTAASPEEAPGEAAGAAYSTAETALRASSDPNVTRLASVDGYAGFGLRAISVWQRDTERNGRDLYVTLPQSNGSGTRVWRTREDVVSVRGVRHTSAGTTFLGDADVQGGFFPDTYWSRLEYFLDATIQQTGGTIGDTLELRQKTLMGERSYSVEASTDPWATLLGEIDDVRTDIGSEARARLLTLDPTHGREANRGRLVLVLADAGGYHVFPLDLEVDGERDLAFVGPRELRFASVTRATDSQAQEKVTRWAVTWTNLAQPSIRQVP